MALSAPPPIPPPALNSEPSAHGSCQNDNMNHSPPTSNPPSHDSGNGIFRDESLLEYSDQYLSFQRREEHKADDSDPTLSLSMKDKEHNTQNLPATQLRSLSPTPSPRSSSASLVITEGSGTDGDSVEHIKGHAASSSMSQSFKALGGQRNGSATLDDGAEAYSPKPISKVLLPHQLSDIKEEKIIRKLRRPSGSEDTPQRSAQNTEELRSPSGSHEDALRQRSRTNGDKPRQPSLTAQDKPRRPSHSQGEKEDKDGILRLGPEEMAELTSAPESLPMSPPQAPLPPPIDTKPRERETSTARLRSRDSFNEHSPLDIQSAAFRTPSFTNGAQRPFTTRVASTPHLGYRERSWRRDTDRNGSPVRRQTSVRGSNRSDFDMNGSATRLTVSWQRSRTSVPRFSAEERIQEPRSPSKAEQEIPLPPLLSTYLQLELASSRPSPLYIHRPRGPDYQFESAKLKFERLVNFLYVPVMLEPAMLFGTLSCLDAWLYTFTILPLRFLKAVGILARWWGSSIAQEVRYISGFVWDALPRFWQRQRGRGMSVAGSSAGQSRTTSRAVSECNPRNPLANGVAERRGHRASDASVHAGLDRVNEKLSKENLARIRSDGKTHKRTRSIPSTLTAYHKSDILQGLVIIFSCVILMQLDASRMYHSIRGQAAMKLYVIYNVLEVGDRLLSAVGQDILECLTSTETLGRLPSGRSHLLRPLGMFLLTLIYNVLHATALFYQVITLNVAVNSYSNSLFTLLLSNQFVEIKGTVFKRIEKANLFQLFCADVVERFQLWLMLVIIGMRNVVEVGGLSIASSHFPAPGGSVTGAINATTAPLRSTLIPNAFSLIPSWSGEVLTPFLVVLGSEILVDWVKHCFVTKFNNVKPRIYRNFLDILAKDYYSNAFVDQNLTKRLGLPVIPLSCLFIRASVQTYHMFLAAHFPPPLPSAVTGVVESGAGASPSAATTKAMEGLDAVIRKALGRATYGEPDAVRSWWSWDSDDLIAFIAMGAFFLGAFLALLAIKLVLGMLLLRWSRGRYEEVGERERREKGGNKENRDLDTMGKRLGGLGIIELDEGKKEMIYEDDPKGLEDFRKRESKWKDSAERERKEGADFEGVTRYEMSGKRIW